MVAVKNVSLSLLALLAAQLAQCQTFTECDPLTATCPDDPGLAQKTLAIDFKGLKSLPGEWTTENAGTLSFGDQGASLTVAQSGDSKNIVSKFYVFFGSFEFRVKASPGQGMASNLVLISDVRDEIDIEILGKEPTNVQSNYFGKGDDAVFDRGGNHATPNNQVNFIDYKIDWTPQAITWYINGAAVRTLKYEDAKGGSRFPQTPMRIKIGAWAPGDPAKNREGTVQWAGQIDWKQAPFSMVVESLKITNYSPANSYAYGDKSGSYQSIKITDGALMSDSGASSAPSGPSSSGSSKPPASSSSTPPPSKDTSSSSAPPADSTSKPGNSSTSSTTPSSSSPLPTTSTTRPPPVATTNGASRASFGFALMTSASILAAIVINLV